MQIFENESKTNDGAKLMATGIRLACERLFDFSSRTCKRTADEAEAAVKACTRHTSTQTREMQLASILKRFQSLADAWGYKLGTNNTIATAQLDAVTIKLTA